MAGGSFAGQEASWRYRAIRMDGTRELQGVEIEFSVDWYDGPVMGVAVYDGAAYWFEPVENWDPGATARVLKLFPLTVGELAAERELNLLYEKKAAGTPVEDWPQVLRERDFGLPTQYGVREPIGCFVHKL